MNAKTIISDEMTLEQKLAAIDAAMLKAQEEANTEAKKRGIVIAPLDPADLTTCEGCQ